MRFADHLIRAMDSNFDNEYDANALITLLYNINLSFDLQTSNIGGNPGGQSR